MTGLDIDPCSNHQFNRYLAIPKHIHSSEKENWLNYHHCHVFSQEQFSSIDLSARLKKMFQRWSRTQPPHSCSGESFSERDAARVPSPSERLGVSCPPRCWDDRQRFRVTVAMIFSVQRFKFFEWKKMLHHFHLNALTLSTEVVLLVILRHKR